MRIKIGGWKTVCCFIENVLHWNPLFNTTTLLGQRCSYVIGVFFAIICRKFSFCFLFFEESQTVCWCSFRLHLTMQFCGCWEGHTNVIHFFVAEEIQYIIKDFNCVNISPWYNIMFESNQWGCVVIICSSIQYNLFNN